MTKEELFENNQLMAYKIANTYKINHFKEYEDIKQQALLGLWNACLTYDGRNAFSTYAYPCIRNTINQYLRQVVRHSVHDRSIHEPIGEGIYIEDTIASETDEIEEMLDCMVRCQVKEKLTEVIDEVVQNDRDKKVLHLYLKGYTQTKIANMMKLSQCQISRVQKKIRNRLSTKLLGGHIYG